MDIARVSAYVGVLGFVFWALVERGFSLLNQKQHKGRKQSQGSYWLISVSWYGATLFSLADAWRLRWTTFGRSLWGLYVIGSLLTIGGIGIRILARRALGQQYSVHVETSEAHRLVTRGIFGVLRHPAYLGLACLFLGIPLCEGSWGGLVLALVGGLPAIVYRIHIEEKSLSEWFGEAYEQYRESTWRLIPYVW